MMDSGEVYRVASLRRNNSPIWRNNSGEVFSRSSRDEDDEEALLWAALERLPTYNRIRKGIPTDDGKEIKEIDIKNLGFQEKKQLIERLLKVAEEDNEKFLFKLKNRIDRVGIDIPTIEVRYENLTIDAEAYAGSRALPTILNYFANYVEGCLSFIHILPSRKKPIRILNDISGVIKPLRLTLLLRPPSSGKTTLLLALAGRLDKNLAVSGKVTYNGHEMYEFVPQRTSAYISQYDLHIGEMTVRQTLNFSARCQGAGTGYDMLAELSRREKVANIKPDPDIDVYMKSAALEGQEASVVTDYILKILGLEVCADTMLGDEMVRGVSDGQKKRVTTGEMLVGPARALFMDEISNGLHSSTMFQIVNSIRQTIHIMHGTAVISLLQPAPETYDLFDDIILISDQQTVYQGPRENVLEFFEYMGFKCPERKGVADFLQEVTSKKDQRQYWARKDEPYNFIPVQDFAEAFQRTGPFNKEKSHPAALTTERYGISKKELLKACTAREYLLMKRNSFVYIFNLFQLLIQAIIGMTLFFHTELKKETINDGGVYLGALFFALTVILFNGFSELAMTVVKLPVFYKQRDLLFFPTWILKIPVTISEVALWVFVTYYVMGFDPNVERLFRQFFLLLFLHQVASGLFRTVAALGRNMVVASTVASFVLVILLAFSGFILSRGPYWYWLGVGALFGYLLLLNLFFTLALTYLSQRSEEIKASMSSNISDEANQNRKRGMVLPFQPHSITFDNITYAVDMPAKNWWIYGSISISSYPKKQETFARISGYCEQNDIHSPFVTVYESISYSAWLRLPNEVDPATRKMFAEEVMELVELTPLRGALVGLPGVNGLSTEQRKRLTIAVELVANPSIIFMDEPTSGLDARAAAIVMRAVRNTVDTGRTVVCTIHQPSIDIFEAFDELFLMKRGGEEIYVGPLGHHSCHLISYFEGIEGVSKIKDRYNPATWMLEVTSAAGQESGLGVNFTELYQSSEHYGRNKQLIKDLNIPPPGTKDLYFPTKYSRSFFSQCSACLWKQHWSYWRNPQYNAVRFFFTTIVIEIPYVLIQSVIYGVLVYAMIGFEWTTEKFFWNLFFTFFSLLYFTYYGMMTVAITPNSDIAAIISSAFYGVWNLFCGFVIPRPRIAIWWRWYYWACPVAWSLYGLVITQYGDIQTKLESEETVEEFLGSYFGFKNSLLPVVAVVIVGINVFFAFVFAFAIRTLNFQKR
ncbi:hypothetical protein MKX03_014734 [Papaver bracteatum]|nr:hypothetical protein MKX03_014734 [Papaver bracteatum]